MNKIDHQAFSIISELNFHLKHGNVDKRILVNFRNSVFELYDKKISPEVRDFILYRLDKWRTEEICVLALKIKIQFYIHSITE